MTEPAPAESQARQPAPITPAIREYMARLGQFALDSGMEAERASLRYLTIANGGGAAVSLAFASSITKAAVAVAAAKGAVFFVAGFVILGFCVISGSLLYGRVVRLLSELGLLLATTEDTNDPFSRLQAEEFKKRFKQQKHGAWPTRFLWSLSFACFVAGVGSSLGIL